MLIAKEAKRKTDNVRDSQWLNFLNTVVEKINQTICEGNYKCEIFAPNSTFAQKIQAILLENGYQVKTKYDALRPISPDYPSEGNFVLISWEETENGI